MKNQERITHREEILLLIEGGRKVVKTQEAFRQVNGLAYTTFYNWLKRYRRELDESNFLPVEVSSGSYIEIRYPGGLNFTITDNHKALQSIVRNIYKSLKYE